jgi:hypothetical protein
MEFSWLSMLLTFGLLGAFAFLGTMLFIDARARRVSNLIQLTQQHRELWERMFIDPRLARVLDPTADIEHAPVTAEEEMFVIFIILHLNCTFYAMKSGFYPKPEGLAQDIEMFFSLPIPRALWEKVKSLQDRRFVAFVDASNGAKD